MVIFHSYVSLPEGIKRGGSKTKRSSVINPSRQGVYLEVFYGIYPGINHGIWGNMPKLRKWPELGDLRNFKLTNMESNMKPAILWCAILWRLKSHLTHFKLEELVKWRQMYMENPRWSMTSVYDLTVKVHLYQNNMFPVWSGVVHWLRTAGLLAKFFCFNLYSINRKGNAS